VDFDQLGEFGLIERIQQLVGDFKDPSILSIGDDAAIVSTPNQDKKIVFTTDAMVEGVHFDLDYTPMESLGWKALAINVSDVAAMGGMPKYVVISLAIPKHWKVEAVDELYQGMIRCSREYGCHIVGGDTVRSKDSGFISVAVIGEVDSQKVAARDGAQPGDYLGLSRPVGSSRVGLEVLESKLDYKAFQKSVKHFLEPKPELSIAQKLVSELEVSSLIDVSDGLASEIGHLCRMSKVGCLVQFKGIPISSEAKEWCGPQDRSPFEFAMESGEEYALLFTVDPQKYSIWLKDQQNPPIYIIGKIVQKKQGIQIEKDGEMSPLTFKGWDHFKK